MRLFALDSSIEANFSIAILDSNKASENQIIFQENYYNYNYNNNSNKANNKVKFTESFFPIIEAKPALIENIDYFIINRGPGSYTGVRAGSAALAGLTIGKQSEFLGVNSFILMAYKFFQASCKNSCETKSFSINSKKAHVFLKSYQEEYFYYQAVEFIINDNDYNLLKQPRKISIYEILEEPNKYHPLVTNLTEDSPGLKTDLNPEYRAQYSALDLALFIQEQLLINNKAGLKILKYKETYPIYIQ